MESFASFHSGPSVIGDDGDPGRKATLDRNDMTHARHRQRLRRVEAFDLASQRRTSRCDREQHSGYPNVETVHGAPSHDVWTVRSLDPRAYHAKVLRTLE